MARGAVLARKEARRQTRRAERLLEGDARVRELLEEPFVHARQDWSLIRCEACGLEQGSSRLPCAICGHELAGYAEAA